MMNSVLVAIPNAQPTVARTMVNKQTEGDVTLRCDLVPEPG